MDAFSKIKKINENEETRRFSKDKLLLNVSHIVDRLRYFGSKNRVELESDAKKEEKAVISVFLALIFPLIFSLIASSYQSVISLSASNYARRILGTALESSLGEYYRPLFDEYKIFGLDTKNSGSEDSLESVKQRISESIDFSINTQSKYNAYPLTLEKIDIENPTYLIDFDGDLYKKQVLDYAKYDEFAELIELLLEKCNLLDDQSKTSTMLQEKMALEEDLAQIDERIIHLMELVDGIIFSGNEIMTDYNDEVVTADYFIKVYQQGDISAESMGINNGRIFRSLQNKYINPVAMLEEVKSCGIIYAENRRRMDAIDKELESLSKSFESLMDYVEQLVDEKADEDVIESVVSQIDSLNDTYKALSEERQRVKEIADESFDRGYGLICIIENSFCSVIYSTREALQDIAFIRETQKETKPKVIDFGDTLSKANDILSSELLADFTNSYELMKEYVGIDGESAKLEYDIDTMEETLKSNMTYLANIESNRTATLPMDVSEEAAAAWVSTIDSMISNFSMFRYEGLFFDYSKCQFETKKNSILKGFMKIFKGSFYDLLIPDYEKISQKEIMKENLPSDWMGVVRENSIENITEDIDDKSGSELLKLTDDSADVGSISSFIKGSMISIIERVVYIMYLKEHFTDYRTEKIKENHPTQYELEYIVAGNDSDSDNLESIALRILMLRLIVNTVHVFSDSEKAMTANNFALTVVGFTGLPFLTALVKYLVLFVWAFEQAAVDTMAIMMGKEVPLIATKASFQIRFDELLLINKEFIKDKAQKVKKKGISMDYRDYLNIFLLIRSDEKLNYRSMDLIQSHIRFEYDTSFYLSNCLFGYDANAEFTLNRGNLQQKISNQAAVCYR